MSIESFLTIWLSQYKFLTKEEGSKVKFDILEFESGEHSTKNF